MKATAAFVLCVGVYGSFLLAIPANSDDPISPYLKLVATVDGKSFFADRTTRMNWFEAGEFCLNFGMKLAEITSKAQSDALQAAYGGPDFIDGHWTAARDAQLPRQFSWNSTEDELSGETIEVIQYWANPVEFQTCLLFWGDPGNDTKLFIDSCKSTQYVLCST